MGAEEEKSDSFPNVDPYFGSRALNPVFSEGSEGRLAWARGRGGKYTTVILKLSAYVRRWGLFSLDRGHLGLEYWNMSVAPSEFPEHVLQKNQVDSPLNRKLFEAALSGSIEGTLDSIECMCPF